MTKIKCILTTLLLLIIFTCGCQPTPTRNPIVYRVDLLKKLEGTVAPYAQYIAPTSWMETLQLKGNDTKIKIDASTYIPDVKAFPVYKVKQLQFNLTQVTNLVNYFSRGKEIVEYADLTKAELEEQLLQAKKDKNDEMVKDIENRIKTAPETVTPEVITNWSPDKSPAGWFLTDSGESAGISASSDTFMYMNGYVLTDKIGLLNDKKAIGDIAISEKDAVDAAQGLLQNLGIDYMTLDSMEKAERYSSLESAFTSPSVDSLSKGYLIKFARNISGIAGITEHDFGFYGKEEINYKAPLYPEEIQVYVDETAKPQSFVWSHPLRIEDTVTENAPLLPFDEIKQRIRDMLTYIHSYNSNPADVTAIKMNMTIVDIKDHSEDAMVVPAWFVYYTMSYDDVKQDYILALNAIDGGRIAELPIPEQQTK